MRSRPSARDTKQKIKKTYTKVKRICDHGLPREILHSKDTTIQSVLGMLWLPGLRENTEF